MFNEQAWWYFGTERVIQELNSDKDYVKLKTAARDTFLQRIAAGQLASEAGYFGGVDADRIHFETGGKFFAADSAYYEIGGDFGQMFDTGTHSTCLIAIRDASLPYGDKGGC